MRARLLTALLTVFAAFSFASSVQAQQCSQPFTSGPNPTAGDCLYILRTAVGVLTCTPACICAPKGTLPTNAADALLCLRKAVGQAVTLNCPCDGTTTTSTTLPTTTTVPTTTTIVTTTTIATTTTSTTTTTTGGGNIEVGREIYDLGCSFCHAATPYDTDGELASDLAGDGNLLVPDLGTLDSMMDGIMMSEQEIKDLGAFLDSLQ